MTDDYERIRDLIERWAEAVHRGDIDGVVAGHADDIVMFDVPPPYEGVRGLDAYRETWPPFFAWQVRGACFEIESLDVTAGEDVAFAHALLRCGSPEELAANPRMRLRLTLGLRRQDDRWVIAHEHHSFPYVEPDADSGTAAEKEVRELHRRWFARTAAGDLEGLMTGVADDVVSYEHDGPLRLRGVEAVREVCARGLDAATEGGVSWDVPDLKILVRQDLAVAWGLNNIRVEQAGGESAETWSRGTRVFERRDGVWVMIHQHLSFPYDPVTGEARTGLSP
ncbi:YybH family protein [Microbispora triticiradicis]|uniref:SgcJ/EcaC family oxidoreductase n=2 Tax=Microbispora TaxID=2005 RepID=A0ABY3LZQ8_9ACTN|nr:MULTISPECIES: SgcJ/EcaC family oxidoreductase [Microbispora]TLP58738.1 SgcJ/EcaC family oxidoreductase [Microbispora fusca]TYB61563.1 SgcJ/EcaC family oxidoreductase [Microbispora tritici]